MLMIQRIPDRSDVAMNFLMLVGRAPVQPR
jgi:hypothetical protein